jgi:ribosomal protein L6P/L9E
MTEALRGTYASHLMNMIKGVNETFTKKLILEGIGYKADVKGTDLVHGSWIFTSGKKAIPATLKLSDKGIITITGH